MIRHLLHHHNDYGGGLRWMELHGDRIIPKVPTRFEGASYYRFRLWQVCRLAVQCGVIETMPVALARGENGSEEE
jgi:hypothetical protein